MTDLSWIVKNGELNEVKKYVETEGQDVVGTAISGRSPLHYAADYGHKDIIEYLISMGADINVQDKHGITPVLAAIWEGHTECVKILIAKGARKDGKSPDGSSYLDCAEKDEIKELLK